MAERIGEALLELGTDDKVFVAGVKRAETQTIKLGRDLEAASQSAIRLGKDLSAGLTTPVTAMGEASQRAFAIQAQAIDETNRRIG
ncbi:MAG: hypothetical protein R3D34_06875 [Nitratireductor sp.]